MRIEYKVKAVERYIVTRYDDDGNGLYSCVERGEYASPYVANEVACALCAADAQRLRDEPELITDVELVGV